MSLAIIINPISGGARPSEARRRADLALACVARHGEGADVFVTEHAGHAKALAEAAARRGVRLVLVWGGDGTINEVASALAFGETPLGIIPSGSGNGLATELGISRCPEAAIVESLLAEPRPIDLGELEGRLFVNIAGIGLDASIAARFNHPGNQRRGLLSYARMTSQALLTYTPACYRIVSEQGQVEVRAVLVTIANSAQFGNNARIAPNARVDDGLLDIVVVAEDSRLKTIWSLPKLFNGSVARAPGYSTFRVRQATIESDEPMTFHVDGEPVAGGTRLSARVHPGALRLSVKAVERPRLP